MKRYALRSLLALGLVLAGTPTAHADAAQPFIQYTGIDHAPGQHQRVVLVSGDEEYRSEEALPQLAAILAYQHGYDCTVLFAINPETGFIDPTYTKNIPGLEALDNADLMIIFTRFRDLPDAQMQHVDAFLKAGKPVIGLRTATHAFQTAGDGPWARYGNGYGGDDAWKDGFGRLVLGEHWISHHGDHKQQSTVGLIAPNAQGHPILNGITNGGVWGATDVYGVRLPLPGDSTPVLLGQVTKRAGAFDANDLFYGMRPTDNEPVAGAKNDPMMPIAWTKSYQVPDGKTGQVFMTTMGASSDLTNEGLRRLLVNAVYWCTGKMKVIPAGGCKVNLVGDYAPTKFEFRSADYWKNRALTPAACEVKPK